MKKYQCSICGYIYDEEIEKVKFNDLPDDWQCPLCGAPKSLFVELVENDSENNNTDKAENDDINNNTDNENEELRELSDQEIAYICSSLARGCEKQYLDNQQKLFQELYEYYEEKIVSKEGTLDDIFINYDKDITMFNDAMNVAERYNDSGAKRIITWSLKTSNIIKAILKKYQENGFQDFKNTKIWVCDICGFVYIGNQPPEVCPVCKVPNFKIMEVK